VRSLGVAALVVLLVVGCGSGPAVAYRGPVPILMYHEVRSPPPPRGRSPRSAALWVPAGRFEAQIAGLARAGYQGVTLRQVWAAWHGGPALPPRPVVVSFDDGYAGQYSVAASVLASVGWPGVLNLVVDRLGARGGLTSAQVRRLVRRGWELASHSLTHADLTRAPAARLRRELAGSRAMLRRRFGAGVAFFCYPYGRFDDSVVAAVQAAGYRGATTTVAGVATPSGSPFELPRIGVRPTDTAASLARRFRP
jgi:peptidoglycan/xylan/chitin deacetylase (PgdA/CDA1 family)